MKKLILPLLLLTTTYYSCTIGHSQESGNLRDEVLRRELQSVFDKHKLVGMSVFVVENFEPVFSANYGFANRQTQTPIGETTKYRIASISKTFTAVGLMMLYDKGLFKLDDDVSSYLGYKLRNPKFPDTPITFRILLNHTSSIVDSNAYNEFLAYIQNDSLVPTVESLVVQGGAFFKDEIYATNQPGTFFEYSNLGYGIIGCLVEKISRQRFDVYCRENIFKRLGMNASFNISDISDVENIAVLYRNENGVTMPSFDYYPDCKTESRNLADYELGSNALLFAPQGGLRCSAADLSKFMLMLMHNGILGTDTIIKPETVNLMLAQSWTTDGANGSTFGNLMNCWGLGFHVITNQTGRDVVFPEHQMFGHPGEAYGLISDMYFDRNSGTGIIFMTNGTSGKYEYGTETTFYAVEEDVFKTVYKFLRHES